MRGRMVGNEYITLSLFARNIIVSIKYSFIEFIMKRSWLQPLSHLNEKYVCDIQRKPKLDIRR